MKEGIANRPGLILLLCLVLAGLTAGFALAGELEECTTAVIAGPAAADGNPILWKNRDTDSLSNKISLVREKPFDYLAVVNAAETSGRIVWGGLNSAGFAIINSVAYNLPQESGEAGDLEGHVMADALRSCATADDFEDYLKANLGAGLGVQTNFCVIDASGGAAIFEAHNHDYKRLDASDAPEKYLLNTNFSRSGKTDKGAGYLRFDRENELFRAVPPGKLTHGFVLQTAARDLGKLDNRAGTGWLPRNLELELGIIEETARFLETKPAPAQLSDFQQATAARVLAALQRIP